MLIQTEFEGFGEEDFAIYRQACWASNLHNRARMQTKDRLNALARRLQGFNGLTLEASSEIPSVWNQRQVKDQWVYALRQPELRKRMAPAFAKQMTLSTLVGDPAEHHRHAVIALKLDDKGFEIGLRLHSHAVIDLENLIAARATNAASVAELCNAMPSELQLKGQKVTAEALYAEAESCLAQGTEWVNVVASLDAETVINMGVGLVDHLNALMPSLRALYDAVAWSEANDFIGLCDRLTQWQKERAEREQIEKAEAEKAEAEKAERVKAARELAESRQADQQAWRARSLKAKALSEKQRAEKQAAKAAEEAEKAEPTDRNAQIKAEAEAQKEEAERHMIEEGLMPEPVKSADAESHAEVKSESKAATEAPKAADEGGVAGDKRSFRGAGDRRNRGPKARAEDESNRNRGAGDRRNRAAQSDEDAGKNRNRGAKDRRQSEASEAHSGRKSPSNRKPFHKESAAQNGAEAQESASNAANEKKQAAQESKAAVLPVIEAGRKCILKRGIFQGKQGEIQGFEKGYYKIKIGAVSFNVAQADVEALP